MKPSYVRIQYQGPYNDKLFIVRLWDYVIDQDTEIVASSGDLFLVAYETFPFVRRREWDKAEILFIRTDDLEDKLE